MPDSRKSGVIHFQNGIHREQAAIWKDRQRIDLYDQGFILAKDVIEPADDIGPRNQKILPHSELS